MYYRCRNARYNRVTTAFFSLSGISVRTGNILMDIRKPNYTWTNETQVVKQGISVLLTMLAGMAVIALPAIALFVLGTQYAAWILVGDCVILLVLTGSIHGKLIKARI